MPLKKIKRFYPVLLGLLLGIISILYLSELFQFLFGKSVGISGVSLRSGIFGFKAIVTLGDNAPEPAGGLTALASYLFLLLTLEFGNIILRKTGVGFIRFSVIIFQIVIVIGIISEIFYDAFLLILKSAEPNDLKLFTQILNLTYEESIGMIFFFLILFVFYLNFAARRVTKYIN